MVVCLLLACCGLSGCSSVAAARFELVFLLGLAFVALSIQLLVAGTAISRVSVHDTSGRPLALTVGLLAAAGHTTLLIVGSITVLKVDWSVRQEVMGLYGLLLAPGIFHVGLPLRLWELRNTSEQDDGRLRVPPAEWSLYAAAAYVVLAGVVALSLLAVPR
jgi:hypothetical protein